MNVELFLLLFVFQFIGHRVGDYLLQSNYDALNKTRDWGALTRHVCMYTISIIFFVAFITPWYVTAAIGLITFIEHMIVDTRKPVLGYKNLFEKEVMGNHTFKAEDLPFFVLVEIDQTFHYLRIFLISLAVAWFM